MMIISSRAAKLAMVAFGVFAAQPSIAADGSTVIQAIVPLKCSASLQSDIVSEGSSRFNLGNISYFCNSPFELHLSHGAVAGSARFLVDGVPASGLENASYNHEFDPGYGSMSLTLTDASQQEASDVAATMQLTINALGL